MKEQTLSITINKPVKDVFTFAITPPNSTRWIPGIIIEETSEWPIRVGTVYRLKNEQDEWSEVTVSAIKENEIIEWVSSDNIYHCRYTLKDRGGGTTELIYEEWVDRGELTSPFSVETLNNFKYEVES